MKVKAKMNIILDGKKINQGDEFKVEKDEYKRIKNLVDVVEETVEDKAVKPEEELEKKVVKKGSKKSKKSE